MKNNSFGQGLIVFFVIVGILFIIGSIGEARNVLRLDAIISRQVEAVIVIYINHILEAVHHRIAALHIVVNRQAVPLPVVQAAQVVATVMNQRQQLIHHMVAVLRRVVLQMRIHMILIVTDMMTYLWMVIMTTTDMV